MPQKAGVKNVGRTQFASGPKNQTGRVQGNKETGDARDMLKNPVRKMAPNRGIMD